MPIGIDTERFRIAEMQPWKNSVLFLGRIDPVKNPLVFLEAIERMREAGIDVHTDIYGDPTYPQDPQFVIFKERASFLVDSNLLLLHSSVPNAETPAIFSQHMMYVNLTPSGSFDKTIGEAMASGCLIIASNDALRGVIPEECIVDPTRAQEIVRAIVYILGLDDVERERMRHKYRDFIEHQHSLVLLSEKLITLLEAR